MIPSPTSLTPTINSVITDKENADTATSANEQTVHSTTKLANLPDRAKAQASLNVIMAAIAHQIPATTKLSAAGKGKKLCTTCYKKAIQSGSLTIKKAQLAKKSKAKKSTKDSPVFNKDQLQVLHQIHANSVTKTDMQDAITDVPAGPASTKIDTVFSRLGHSTQNHSNQVTSALLSITGNQH